MKENNNLKSKEKRNIAGILKKLFTSRLFSWSIVLDVDL